MPDHCRSTAVAWCGSGAASVSLQSKSLRGSDQSLESGAAVSTPCASGSQPRDLSAPPGAETHDIKLLVVVFSASPHAGFPDLAEPFRTVTWGIHFLASAGNGPTAIQRLESIHNPREISIDGQITACQLLHRSQAVLSVVHRLDLVHIQQF